MQMTGTEIRRRFKRVKPEDPEAQKKMDLVYDIVRVTAENLADMLPAGRETSIVMRKLEEAVMWSVAALMRTPAYTE